jgi:hypothetical protein
MALRTVFTPAVAPTEDPLRLQPPTLSEDGWTISHTLIITGCAARYIRIVELVAPNLVTPDGVALKGRP